MSQLKKVKIGDRLVDDGEKCLIIAEAGSNHDRKFEQALKLIDIAVEAKADAIKFQLFRAEKMYPKIFKKVDYLEKLGIKKSIYDIIKEMEMPYDWIPKISEYCKKKNIIFLSTPFDKKSVDILDEYVPAFKVASYELTHIPLITNIAKKGKPMIISTGASNLEEIRETVDAVYKIGNNEICLMQCTAKYPAPLESINLRAINTLKREFGVPVGLSDHSQEPLLAPCLAVAIGANLIEKHFTINKYLPGPDHLFALEPSELKEMVSGIRKAENLLGSGDKVLQEVEQELVKYRRAVFTIKNIKEGEVLSENNIAILRKPGTGENFIFPKEYKNIIGKKVIKDLHANYCLTFEDIES